MAESTANTFVMGGAARDEPVEIDFADSRRAVPGWVVAHYGGEEKLLADAALLSGVTYADFFASFDEAVEREHLNQKFNAFVGAHLSRVLR